MSGVIATAADPPVRGGTVAGPWLPRAAPGAATAADPRVRDGTVAGPQARSTVPGGPGGGRR